MFPDMVLVLSDQFTILVITGSNTARHSFSGGVGNVSRSHHLDAEVLINLTCIPYKCETNFYSWNATFQCIYINIIILVHLNYNACTLVFVYMVLSTNDKDVC